jgi:hypothetical protein
LDQHNDLPLPDITPCPLCGGDRILARIEAEAGDGDARHVRLVTIVCVVCGATTLFDRNPSQLLPKSDDDA